MGQGATVEEALESVVDAIQGVVAARMEDNLRSLNLGNTRSRHPRESSRFRSATARVATLTTSRVDAGQLLNQRSGSVFMTGR
jgi:hypothetical protein